MVNVLVSGFSVRQYQCIGAAMILADSELVLLLSLRLTSSGVSSDSHSYSDCHRLCKYMLGSIII